MTATKEKFPTRGDTVLLQTIEKRPHSQGVTNLVYEVDVLVTSTYPEESLLIGTELKRFCYVEGSREKGRRLPQENPYGDPGTNGYILNETNWRVINDVRG
jgi:hypothetical protein